MSEEHTGTVVPSDWRRGPAAKILGVIGVFVAMLIPQALTSGLIHERESRLSDVLATFRSGWGPEQVVGGPVLVVPYSVGPVLHSGGRAQRVLRLAASNLDVTVTLDPQRRRRGLFEATVYTAAVQMSGVLTIPSLPTIPGEPEIDWAGARIVIGTSDLRGMQPDQTMEWNGSIVALQPDMTGFCDAGSLVTPPANLTEQPAPGTVIPFKAALTLRGTQVFTTALSARRTTLHVTSAWPTPGFRGTNLPVGYTAGPAGFDARWDIPGAPSLAGWTNQASCSANPWQGEANPSVGLQEAVPTYAMVDRAAKYGVFFLALAYLTLFLFEALSRVRIHLVQYGLVGLSVSLFALLLISIAEPLGFTAAYALGATAVVGQASLYTLSVIGRARLAAVFAGVLGALFCFIYVVLNLDSYALLAGTVALFAILSVLMAATRRVDWGTAQTAE